METQNRTAILALTAAGLLWGLTVPLSKLSLTWLGPGWLTVARFAASAPLLALAARGGLRDALVPRVAGSGAIGFGVVIVLQNAGVQHTSVSHAAVLLGVVPVLVALIAAGVGQAAARPVGWVGYGVALAGLALVAGTSGNGSTARGDLLVLGSAVLSAGLIAIQPRLLGGRDPGAVTAVQFAAAALVAVPFAAATEGAPHAPVSPAPLLALAALSLAGTLMPFWLFAFGQARVPAQIAGAYLNLEPVVGAAVGWLAFGDTAALRQVAGATAVLAGIFLSTLSPRAAARVPSGDRNARRSQAERCPSSARRRRLGPRELDPEHVAASVPPAAGQAGPSGRDADRGSGRAYRHAERNHPDPTPLTPPLRRRQGTCSHVGTSGGSAIRESSTDHLQIVFLPPLGIGPASRSPSCNRRVWRCADLGPAGDGEGAVARFNPVV